MKCPCKKSRDLDMRRIAHVEASAGTNHGFIIYWCLSCGRCVIVDRKDGSEMWCTPDLAKEYRDGK